MIRVRLTEGLELLQRLDLNRWSIARYSETFTYFLYDFFSGLFVVLVHRLVERVQTQVEFSCVHIHGSTEREATNFQEQLLNSTRGGFQ